MRVEPGVRSGRRWNEAQSLVTDLDAQELPGQGRLEAHAAAGAQAGVLDSVGDQLGGQERAATWNSAGSSLDSSVASARLPLGFGAGLRGPPDSWRGVVIHKRDRVADERDRAAADRDRSAERVTTRPKRVTARPTSAA